MIKIWFGFPPLVDKWYMLSMSFIVCTEVMDPFAALQEVFVIFILMDTETKKKIEQ